MCVDVDYVLWCEKLCVVMCVCGGGEICVWWIVCGCEGDEWCVCCDFWVGW